MKNKKFYKLITVILTLCLLAIPFGCSNSSANDNEFFSSVTIAQANGDVTATPTLNSNPSEGIEVPRRRS